MHGEYGIDGITEPEADRPMYYGVDAQLLAAIALLSEVRSTMPRTYGGEPNLTWQRVDAFLKRIEAEGDDDNA